MVRSSSTPSLEDQETFRRFIREELRNLAKAPYRMTIQEIFLTEQTSVPSKPRRGLIVLADGVSWDPGSGEGVYWYNGTTWKYLG